MLPQRKYTPPSIVTDEIVRNAKERLEATQKQFGNPDHPLWFDAWIEYHILRNLKQIGTVR